MKYIFLDIDGVLNAPGDKNLIEGVIDKNKYSLLIQIINETNAKVVIISSRRLYQEDRNILLKALDEIYDSLSFISFKLLSKYRKDEIKMFLTDKEFESYVILDDIDCYYTLDNEINKHFIYIDGVVGLTKENVDKAIKILNKV